MASRKGKGASTKPKTDVPEVESDSGEMPDLGSDLKMPEVDPTFDTSNAYAIPPTCDVFDVKHENLLRQQGKNVDTRVAYVRIFKRKDGKDERIPGNYNPEEVSTDMIAKRWGSGMYFVKGCNAQGYIVLAGKVPIGLTATAPPAFGTMPGLGWGVPASQANGAQADPIQTLMVKMLEKKINGDETSNPMSEAMADMMKMMALNMQMQMQQMQMQMKMATEANAPANKTQELMIGGLMKMLANGNKAGGETNLEQAMGMMQMGLTLGRQLQGGAPPDKDPDWLKAFAIMADSMGPSIAAIAAQALPNEEQRKRATDTINEHMKARKAEAEGDGAIDVEGEAMPDLGETGT